MDTTITDYIIQLILNFVATFWGTVQTTFVGVLQGKIPLQGSSLIFTAGFLAGLVIAFFTKLLKYIILAAFLALVGAILIGAIKP